MHYFRKSARKMSAFCQRTLKMQIIQGDGFTVTVVKSGRRKTVALKIKDGEVSIHIPNRLPISIAHNFVQKKTSWIQGKLQHRIHQPIVEKHFTNGESFLFLGTRYKLQLVSHERNSVSVIKTSQTLEVHGRINQLSKAAIHAALLSWYRQQAELYLRSQTANLASKTNLKPRTITVKTYKARWGSCGVNADIQFNWKLILAPPEIIDYVIIHELCHIKQHNHSAAFWQLVQHHCPDFKMARMWLKNNGYTLDL